MRVSKDLREFIELLNANGVERLVVGAFAVAWRGHARFTADIDFFVRPNRANAELIVKTLRDFGFGGLNVTADDLCRPDQMLQLGVKPDLIDIVASIGGVSFDEAWNDKIAGSIDGVGIVWRAEELIRNKESAGHMDIADAIALRKRRQRLPLGSLAFAGFANLRQTSPSPPQNEKGPGEPGPQSDFVCRPSGRRRYFFFFAGAFFFGAAFLAALFID
jgi:hypothetical protein